MNVPNPVVETPPPPPVAVTVIVAPAPDAVAVTEAPTKLMDVILDPTSDPSSLIVRLPPLDAAGTHDDPFHVNTSLLFGVAEETLDKLPKF